MSLFKKLILGTTLLALTACGGDDGPGSPVWDGTEPTASASLSMKSDYLKSRGSDPAAQFELGIVEAMRAIEAIYQYRYKHFPEQLPMTPGGMSGDLPDNPDVEFDPAFLENAMTDALMHLAVAQKALERASGEDFAVVLNPDDFWFDIDSNGSRSEDEALVIYLAEMLGNRQNLRDAQENGAMVGDIRFDMADADWALAYVHTLSGMAEIVLSMDPTPGITQITEGRMALFKDRRASDIVGFDKEIDMIAALFMVLRGTPDKVRTRKAHGHFMSMVDSNRDFWRRVMAETDNDREWLPNPDQDSAFGVPVTAEIASGWQDVLSEVEDVLEGDTLVPFWRLESDTNEYGLNMKKLFMDPPETDVILILQGGVLAPYLEKGPIADMGALDDFEDLTGRQLLLFAAWFN